PALATPHDVGIGQQEPVAGEHDGRAEALPAPPAAALRHPQARDRGCELGSHAGNHPGVRVQLARFHLILPFQVITTLHIRGKYRSAQVPWAYGPLRDAPGLAALPLA